GFVAVWRSFRMRVRESCKPRRSCSRKICSAVLGPFPWGSVTDFFASTWDSTSLLSHHVPYTYFDTHFRAPRRLLEKISWIQPALTARRFGVSGDTCGDAVRMDSSASLAKRSAKKPANANSAF